MRAPVIAAFVFLSMGCRDQAAPAPPPFPAEAQPTAPRTAAVVVADAGPPAAFTPERVWGEGGAMGTHIGFAAYTTPSIDAKTVKAAFDAALVEIKRIEDLMTTWRDSDIQRVNGAAGKSAVKVSDETFDIVKESLHASEISEGTFDITFHSLHGLWKFDEDLDPHPPADKDLKSRLPFVNWKNVKLDESAKSIMLTKEKTQIGLGGIAKGYAVDRAVKIILERGLTSFFVQAGGDLYARGKKPDGSQWQAGIRDPRGAADKVFGKMGLVDHAFSTAGDYERSYIVNNRRYHHIIDPRTGYPATACRSVTIWAETALQADEIDDAVFILGPQKGMALVESLEGVGAVIVDAKNNVHISKRLAGKIELVAAPSEGI